MNVDKIRDKLRLWWAALKEAVSKPLDAAFPKPEKKMLFFAVMGLLEIALLYGIAVIDIGIWAKDCSVSGIVAAYILSEDSYPLWLFLLLSAALWWYVFHTISKNVAGNTGRGFDISESNVYGSAREINMKELTEITDIVPVESAMGTILGQLDKTEKRLITSKPVANFNNNLICLAPPGSGKTATIVLNYIIQAIRRGESVITTDTKGEVWSKTVELARRYGYTVRRLDLKNPKCSDGWAILNEINHDDMRAKIASRTIMRNTGDEKDIHASAEEALLTAICLYTDLNDAIPPEEKTLYNATLSQLYEGSAALDAKFEAIKDDPQLRVAYDAYATSVQGSPNLRGNIITNLANRLSILASPAIRELTSTPDIDLTLPGKQKCIYYVVLPDQHNSMKVLSSLFFSFLFWSLCDYADAQMGQKLPVPVNIMIEEAYACGELPTLTNALATVRSRGISIAMIAQGIDQFRLLYGEEMTNSILECCATYACLGANTESTADLFSWLSGQATVKVKTEQHSVGESPFRWGKSYSTGDGRQDLFSSNDIRKMKFQQILLVWQRYDPIMTHTFFYKRHPEYRNGNMPEILANTSVPLSDKEARAFIRAAEEQRIMDYEAWIRNGGDPWAGYTEPKPKYTGPASGTSIPAIIPYPELEKMALEHSAQASTEKADTLLREIQDAEEVSPEDGFEITNLPDDMIWENDITFSESEEELPDVESEEIRTAPPRSSGTPTIHQSPPSTEPETPVILDSGVSAGVFGVPGDGPITPFAKKGKTPSENSLSAGSKKLPKHN